MDVVNVDDRNLVSKRSQFGRQFLIWLGVAVIAFLFGFLPMWWAKRTVSQELETAKRELKRQQIENSLSAAAVYARRGEYEPARQNASSFYTEMQGEMNSSDPKALTAQERAQVPALLSGRDEVITLLSRGDPASADRVSDVFAAYRAITAAVPQK